MTQISAKRESEMSKYKDYSMPKKGRIISKHFVHLVYALTFSHICVFVLESIGPFVFPKNVDNL